MVDPYDWLGLPKPQRPPTYYQLLGVATSVTDPTTIKAAAERQIRRLLPHLSGPLALDAERLWMELEEARDTLLDPVKRSQYDAITPEPPATEEPAAAPAAEAPLSPEELDAATEPDPQPWWKSTPEAASGKEAWWKEAVPEPVAPPPPPPPPRSAATPAPGKLPPVPVPEKRRTGKRSMLPALLVGVIVVGVIGGGVYIATQKKEPTVAKVPPVIEEPRADPKPKVRDPETPKAEDPVPDVPLPKDFTDQLRSKTFTGHAGAVNALAVAGGGSRFASAGTDKTVRLWSITSDASIVRHTFTSPMSGVAWCDRDRRIAAADGFAVMLFDAMKTNQPRPMESPRGGVLCLAATPDGGKALTGLTDGFLRLWDTAAGRSDEWPASAREPVLAVDISSDGTLAAAAVAEGPVSVWNLASRNKVQEFKPHPAGAIAVRFSPDSKLIATAGTDGLATIYDLAGKKEVCRLDGHAGPVTGVAFLPDGRQVATVGVDGTARLWSAETGYPLRWTQMLDGKGNCVTVDPGGRFVLAGTSTGTIHLFPLPRVRPEATTGSAGKPPAEPMAVPDAAAVAKAIAGVKAELSREFTYTRPDDVAILADNLRRRATAENVPPPLRFGLLHEARSLAAAAGDPVTAFRAIEDLSLWFDLDELAEKATTFAALGPDAAGPGLVAVGLVAAERAETDPRPEVLDRLLRRLPAAPPAGTPADQAARLAALRKRAAASVAERKAVLQALDVLKNAPEEQKASQTLGTFLCLTRQEWAAGLPHLAKGTDPRMIEAAKADLATPTDPKLQHRVGDLWFTLAVDQKDHRARRALVGRARTWFERVTKAKLEVADAIKARARLDDAIKLDVPGKDPLTLPLFTPAPVRRAYNTVAADVIRNEWRLDGGAELKPDGVVMPAGAPVLSSHFGLAAGGRMTLAFKPDGREVRFICAGQEFAFAGNGAALRVVLERIEDKLTVTATTDDGEPASRTAELPATNRGPTTVAVRLTGTPAREGGTVLASAIVRGPVTVPLPLPE